MSFLEELHKPDILDCISHLSSDEVFTPPKLVNEILDMLPQELFKSPDTKFLDPCCKSGVFLREIAKRLIEGLADKIPDLEERIEHIFKNQLFGLAITELTALLSRRSVYCSKDASGEYSVCNFADKDGNIEYKRTYHIWLKDKCMMCGASKSEYDRGEELETHAYSFIHTDNLKNSELFKRLKEMKFDVIIGNPPYQLSTTKESAQAKPLYHLFVQQAKKLNPRYITMIIPARWYAGGMGLDNFRQEMLTDNKIRVLVDYPNAADCFPGVDLRGGVCYFLWDRDNRGSCNFTSIVGDNKQTTERALDEHPIFIRWVKALKIIEKVTNMQEESLSKEVSTVSPFGIGTSERGEEKYFTNSLKLFHSKGFGYIKRDFVKTGKNLIDSYKVLLSQTISGNMEIPPVQIFAPLKLMEPSDICTHSYLTVGNYNVKNMALNLLKYLKTKFVRFLIFQTASGIHISKDKFRFVPIQDFNEEWTDEKLYKKYGLTKEEIDFIESMIRPME